MSFRCIFGFHKYKIIREYKEKISHLTIVSPNQIIPKHMHKIVLQCDYCGEVYFVRG